MSPRRSFDSLFSERSDDSLGNLDTVRDIEDRDKDDSPPPIRAASRRCPDIPGLWVFPALLLDDIARAALEGIGTSDIFSGGHRDQVMLFDSPPDTRSSRSTLPTFVTSLLSSLKGILLPRLPPKVFHLVFERERELARQVILNLYPPGEGITSHIDLVNRYEDGILGVSLIGGCTMKFTPSTTNDGRKVEQVYLPPKSIYVLSGEARWGWAHGIEGRMEDLVIDDEGRQETVLRDLRVSVTFRWMKKGADLLS